MTLENAALTHLQGPPAADADVSVTVTRAALGAIMAKRRTFAEAAQAGEVSITGNPAALRELFGMLDEVTPDFPVIEPVKAGGG